jgi:hypothetical protein
MYGIRWQPAIVVAVAACLAVPDVHAQAWLRWGKAPLSQQRDPAKRVQRPVRSTTAAPGVATRAQPGTAVMAPVTAATRRGPYITIREEPPQALPGGAVPTQREPVPGSLQIPPASPPPAFTVPREPVPPPSASGPSVRPAALASAPDAATRDCADCPTQEELKATSAAAGAAAAAAQDRVLQSELKRGLLQGH